VDGRSGGAVSSRPRAPGQGPACPDSACFHASPGGEGEVWAGMLGSACALPPSLSLSSRDGGRGSRQVVASMRVMDDGWGAARGRAPGARTTPSTPVRPPVFFLPPESLAPLFLSLEKSRSIGRKRRMRREENVMVPFSLLPPRLHGWPRVRRPSSILGWRERECSQRTREWRTDGRGRGGVGTRLYYAWMRAGMDG